MTEDVQVRPGFRHVALPTEAGKLLGHTWVPELQIFVGCFENGVWRMSLETEEWTKVEPTHPDSYGSGPLDAVA